MAVSGVLGAAGEATTFEGQTGQTLSILPGGALAGTVDLGAGDDVFQLGRPAANCSARSWAGRAATGSTST